MAFGDEHPDTLISMNNLAATLQSQGALDKAREIQAAMLELIRQALGAELHKQQSER